MNTNIIKYLVREGWLKLSSKHVLKWSLKRDHEALKFALEHGQFKIRALALIAIGKTNDPKALAVMLPYIDDPVPLVSFAAIQALELFALDRKILLRIENKKNFWKKEMARTKAQQAKFNQRSNPLEFASWKQEEKMPRLEEVRQMLKRPIRWG